MPPFSCRFQSTPRSIAATFVLPFALFFLSAPVFSAQPLYHLTDLTALGTSALRPVRAYGVNNRGEVVGAAGSDPADGFHAFLYRRGTLTDLGHLSGNPTIAYDINDNGQVVGGSQVTLPGTPYGGAQHPFLYSGETMTDLGSFDPNDGNRGALHVVGANAINATGQISGTSSMFGYPRAFLYSNGTMTDLGALLG
jgi:probable HAF family extracellular repeat protein